MPILKNAKHEKFARLVADGMAAGKAHRQAGFKTKTRNSSDSAASRLLRNVKISARVDELKIQAAADASEAAKITKADVMRMLRDNFKEARKLKEIGPANRAAELLGKEIGMFVERKRIGPLELADLTDEELEQLAKQFEQVLVSRTGAERNPRNTEAEESAERPSGTRTH